LLHGPHDGHSHEQHQHLNEGQAEHQDSEEQHFEHEQHSTMRAVILVLAISLHVSFFDVYFTQFQFLGSV
jgi:hypothetical protein